MRKGIVFLSLVMLLFCAIQLAAPGSGLLVVGINAAVAWVGFLIGSFGILAEWEWLQQLHLGHALHMLAFLLLAGAIGGMCSPTYLGILTQYIHVSDIFVLLESSIICWLLGSEQRASAVPLLLAIGLAVEYMRFTFRRLRPVRVVLHRE